MIDSLLNTITSSAKLVEVGMFREKVPIRSKGRIGRELRKRTRMSTIRTLTANLDGGQNQHQTDDELLSHYDIIEIPIDEIDFTYQNE